MQTNDKSPTKSKNKNIHANHRARMKKQFLENGFDSFSSVEKLEYYLFFAIPFKDTNPIAHRLLDEFKTFNGVLNATYEGLCRVKGVGEHTALYLKTMLAGIGEYYKSNLTPMQEISCSNDAKEYCENLFVGKQNEEFVVLCLNKNCEVTNAKILAKGSTSEVLIEAKEILYFVMSNHCDRVIVAHNHPTGNPTPSDQDMAFTQKIFVSLGVSDITLLDHIIVSPRGTTSMYETGKLQELEKHAIRIHNFKPPTPNANWKPYINSKLSKKN